jgi:predicted DNA binding CopG/RHH family protein
MARKEGLTPATIDDLTDIPAFDTEEEEATYWATHQLSPALLASMRSPTEEEAPRPRRTRAISLRVDEGLLERIQVLAAKARRPYQSLLKDYLAERVELEEHRLSARPTPMPQIEPYGSSVYQAPEGDKAAAILHRIDLTAPIEPARRVELLLFERQDSSSPDLLSGFVTAVSGTYIDGKALTIEQAIDYLAKLRDRQ